jgi:hypothetical protein
VVSPVSLKNYRRNLVIKARTKLNKNWNPSKGKDGESRDLVTPYAVVYAGN